MASFRQRGKSWRVELSINGKRESATFDTKVQARAWASKRETELREQVHGQLPKYTLREAIERYMLEVSSKKKLHLRELNRLNAFLRNYPQLANKELSKVTTDDLVKWRNDRLQTIQPASVRRDGNVLASLFKIARREWKWIHDNPMADLTLPATSLRRDRRVLDDEVRRLTLASGFNESTPSTSTQ